MRASHREIRKRIMDRMSKISDREFFTSRAYRGYLTDITESATKKYRRPIRVTLFDASEDPTVAYTDYSGIYINVCNHITESMPTRELKSISLEGLNGHEIGHNLYTDMRVLPNALSGRSGSCQSGLPHLRRTKRFLLCGTGEPERI